MNLHIVPDNTFINKFYENLEELGLLNENKIIVRTNDAALKSIRHNLPFAALYSARFSSLVGDTEQYQKVFIHYFTPLMYRWVARHNFQELNWAVWGGDLYNLPAIDPVCYEPLTFKQYVRNDWSVKTILYNLKVSITNAPFKRKAYSKIKNILTWMPSEYKFAKQHLPVVSDYKFFFYENQLPYEKLKSLSASAASSERISLIIGNSGSPTNNHLDVIKYLEENQVAADLFIPVSYGDAGYINFLRRNLTYSYGKVEFVDRYMKFDEYLNFLLTADALVMNTIRPQGYGNILMMMYMGKPVFFNEKNISLPDLTKSELKWWPISSIPVFSKQRFNSENKEAVASLLSHHRLLMEYKQLFS